MPIQRVRIYGWLIGNQFKECNCSPLPDAVLNLLDQSVFPEYQEIDGVFGSVAQTHDLNFRESIVVPTLDGIPDFHGKVIQYPPPDTVDFQDNSVPVVAELETLVSGNIRVTYHALTEKDIASFPQLSMTGDAQGTRRVSYWEVSPHTEITAYPTLSDLTQAFGTIRVTYYEIPPHTDMWGSIPVYSALETASGTRRVTYYEFPLSVEVYKEGIGYSPVSDAQGTRRVSYWELPTKTDYCSSVDYNEVAELQGFIEQLAFFNVTSPLPSYEGLSSLSGRKDSLKTSTSQLEYATTPTSSVGEMQGRHVNIIIKEKQEIFSKLYISHGGIPGLIGHFFSGPYFVDTTQSVESTLRSMSGSTTRLLIDETNQLEYSATPIQIVLTEIPNDSAQQLLYEATPIIIDLFDIPSDRTQQLSYSATPIIIDLQDI